MAEIRPKEPLLAVMLTLLLPGLGQVYAGKVKRGLVFLSINLVCGVALLSYVFNPLTRINAAVIISVIVLSALGLYMLVDSYLCATGFNRANNLQRNPSKGKRVFIILGILFLAFVFNPIPFFAALYVRGNFVQSFKFPSGSMQPALLPGDAILVDKKIYQKSDPARGDVVVFVFPRDESKDLLKRIVGLPGETVQITKEGTILINGVSVTHPVIKSLRYVNVPGAPELAEAVTVPAGSYYVLGDNSATSMDSRHFGTVPRKNIVGKAYKIYYPFHRSGPIK